MGEKQKLEKTQKTKDIGWLIRTLGTVIAPFDGNSLEDNYELDARFAELIVFFEKSTPWDCRATEIGLELSDRRMKLRRRMLDQILEETEDSVYFPDRALESVWRDFRFADNLRGYALAGAGSAWAKDGKAQKARKKLLPILLDLVGSNLENKGDADTRKFCLKILKDAKARYGEKDMEKDLISDLLEKHFPKDKT